MSEVEKYYEYLTDMKGLSEKTVYYYLHYYKHFHTLELTQDNINDFLIKKKNNSVVRGFMKSYLEFLKKHKEFELPSKAKVTKKKKFIRTLPVKDYIRIFKYAYEKKFLKGLMMELIYYGALRREELTKIKLNDFVWDDWLKDNEKHCKLHITGKGKKERYVLIPPHVMNKMFEKLLEEELITPVMPIETIIEVLTSTDIKVFDKNPDLILRMVSDMSYEAIGIKLRTHELRHAFATHLENQGAGIRDIQRYLGHSSTATTEIYLHTDEKKSLENIQEIIKEK